MTVVFGTGLSITEGHAHFNIKKERQGKGMRWKNLQNECNGAKRGFEKDASDSY